MRAYVPAEYVGSNSEFAAVNLAVVLAPDGHLTTLNTHLSGLSVLGVAV